MSITACEAVSEKVRERETPSKCFGCRHAYNDVEEGWNCRKFDAVVVLSSGKTLEWPGQACDRAYDSDCHGDGFERALVPAILRRYPLVWIVGGALIWASAATWLHYLIFAK